MRIPDVIRTGAAVLREENESMVLTGPPGMGKTSAALGIAEALEAEAVIVHPVYREPVDFLGVPSIHNRKGQQVMEWALPGDLPLERLVEDEDKKILLILDDIGQAHPQVQNVLARAFYAGERRLGEHKLAKNVYVIGTTNRVEDAAAVFDMPSFARMRVTFIDLEVNAEDWYSWALQHKEVPEEFASFVHPKNKIGGSKHIFDFTPEARTSCSPRTLHIAGKHWTLMQGKEKQEVIDEWLSGILCKAFPMEFRAHLKLYGELPDVNDIILGKDIDMKFCNKPDIMLLVATSVLKKAEPQNGKHVDAIGHFIARIPQNRVEWAAFMYQEARRLMPKITSNRECAQWAIKNMAELT